MSGIDFSPYSPEVKSSFGRKLLCFLGFHTYSRSWMLRDRYMFRQCKKCGYAQVRK